MRDYEVILRTGRIFDFEMACDALREAGIPFVKQEESVTGIKDGYVQPSMGPGSFFNLLVPKQFKGKAVQVISELPIELTLEPDFWHYGADERSKRWWKIFAMVVLGIAILLLALSLLSFVITRN